MIEEKDKTGTIVVTHGYENMKMTEIKKTINEGKNKGKKNETTPIQQAYLEARAAWTKKKDSGYVEYFNGSVFVSLATGGAVGYTVDNFTGDGSQTVFTMSIMVDDPTQIIVFVGSIYQIATTNYTVGGPANYNITFTSPPPIGLPINVIHTTS